MFPTADNDQNGASDELQLPVLHTHTFHPLVSLQESGQSEKSDAEDIHRRYDNGYMASLH